MRTRPNALLASALCMAFAFGLVACGGGGGGAPATDTGGASTVAAQSPLPVGDPNCPTGGVQLDYGIDDNKNGVLDFAEIDGSENICNGTDGLTALINTIALSVGDTNCPYGGYEVESGLDLDGSGTLDNPNGNGDDEVTSTDYLCNEAYRPLVADTVSSSRIDLDWSGMAGDPSLAFFEVYKDRSWIYSTADAATTTYSVMGLAAGTVYCFMVTGMDSSYNVVTQGPEVCATTSGGHDWWRATDIAGSDVPIARQYHTAVWTGSKMLVWGGYDYDIILGGYTYYNTGGIYDPATDTWTPMTTANAPSARGRHTAIWTGSKMIVWGGLAGSATNTGAIYDPATNTWTPMTTTNAPMARYGHTAVWTGSQMIVWGGLAGSATNTGAMYDPAANAWTATNTYGAPAERYLHTAVWTGDKMIVWGGNDGTTPINSGGIYDSASGTWTVTSTTGAPEARSEHTAVWTGSKMIIWGGSGDIGVGYLNTGGIYDPAANTWLATNITGAPTLRMRQTAVWTDLEMIVWGGIRNAYIEQNTGGIYTP